MARGGQGREGPGAGIEWACSNQQRPHLMEIIGAGALRTLSSKGHVISRLVQICMSPMGKGMPVLRSSQSHLFTP